MSLEIWADCVARRMEYVYDTDEYIRSKVDKSSEFYRAMIYETKVIPLPHLIEGTEVYDLLVAGLQKVFN